ncbi:MAG: META domain-containing protein [Anaerolineae bacterium]
MKYQSNLNLLIALLLVSVSLAGCAQGTVAPTEVATEVPTNTPEPTPTKAAADLDGTLWKLDSYLNSQGESVDVLPGTEITIEFKDGQISGSAGCNTYFGSYEVEGDSLTIGPIGVTEMFCAAPENVMEQESAYLAALQSAVSYQATDDQLQMANADGEIVLTFSVLEPTPLTGTTWRLTGYNNGQGGFVSLLIGTEITALFGDDGSLTGSAGCNNYKASYEVDGETISIGPAGATRMMCAKPKGIMEQESAYLAALESAAIYQIKGDSLKMLDADGKHLLSYTAATTEETGLANPASVYCKERGGRLEIRTADDGGAVGYCIFPDGSECEEWAFFRGECAPASASSLSLEALKNAAYQSEWEESGPITLTDGRYEGEPFVEGGASRLVVTLVELVAFGDLDDDGAEDAAVILAANAGGSGTFISLEAVRNEGGKPVHVATYSLGDRARIESLAIEGGQILLEMITHGPDDPMCCPTQRVRNVYALEGDTLIEVSSEVIGAVEEPSKPTAQLTLEALQNASYQGIYDEPVQLTDGRYEGEPFVEGGASRPTVMFHPEVYAFGDLNGDGVDDAAVILIENSGGSGNFRYLAAVINEDGAPVNVATQFVGDREQIQTISIDGNEITVEMLAHGPDDPMCCPTQQVVQTYALQEDELVQTSSEVVSPGSAAAPDIVGIVWKWERFSDPAGQNDIVVIYPPAYRLELLPDGQFNIKADCNLGSGGYTLEGSKLTLELGPMTLAECGPSSQYDEYISLLGQVATYERKGDTLILNLMADSGSMTFSKLYAVTGKIVAPAEATLPEKAQVEVKVMDVTQGTPGTQVGGVLRDVTQFPIEFEATYYPPAVQPDNTYVLEVTIKDKDGNPLFTNTQAYPVLTQGNPTYHVEVMVE